MVARGSLRVPTLISITSKSALAATIALALAGCENKAPEPAKPATTAPVFSPENLAQRTNRAPRYRGRHLGHARSQLRPHVPGHGPRRERRWQQQSRLLVPSLELEKPSPHSEPRHHLPHAFLEHKRRGARGA